MSVTPGMLAASVPENSGQPNAFASSGMLIGSTVSLERHFHVARAEIGDHDSVSMASAPSNTGSLVGRVSAKPVPCSEELDVGRAAGQSIGAARRPRKLRRRRVRARQPAPSGCRRSRCDRSKRPLLSCSSRSFGDNVQRRDAVVAHRELAAQTTAGLQIAEHAGGGQRDLHVAGVRGRKLESSRAGSRRSTTGTSPARFTLPLAREIDEVGLREAQRIDRRARRLSSVASRRRAPADSCRNPAAPDSPAPGLVCPRHRAASAVSASLRRARRPRCRGELVGDDGAGLVGQVDAIEIQRGVNQRAGARIARATFDRRLAVAGDVRRQFEPRRGELAQRRDRGRAGRGLSPASLSRRGVRRTSRWCPPPSVRCP